MITRLTIAFLSVFLLVSNIFAKSMTPKEAKIILDKALKLQETRSFTASSSSGEGKSKTIVNVFQKLNKDGSTCRRIDGIAAPKLTHITIKNTEGLFEFFSGSNIAIKIAYKYKYKKYNKGIKYKIKTGYYQKIPCYIITKKNPCNEDSFAFFIENGAKKFTERNIDELRSLYFRRCIVLKIYYIGENDNFIYKKLQYDKNGKLKSTFQYENVNLSPLINDNIFNIPKNYKIKIARTHKEAGQLEGTIIKKIMNSIINSKK